MEDSEKGIDRVDVRIFSSTPPNPFRKGKSRGECIIRRG